MGDAQADCSLNRAVIVIIQCDGVLSDTISTLLTIILYDELVFNQFFYCNKKFLCFVQIAPFESVFLYDLATCT